MSQVTDEQLSAFIDGELPSEQIDLLLARVDGDPALRHRLARYSLIGECMRGVSPGIGALGVAEQVRAALLRHGAPAAAPRDPTPAWRGLATGGLAAAAVVAALLVTGPDAWRTGGAPEYIAAAEEGPSVEDPLEIFIVPPRHRLDPRAAARLTGYLAVHGEYASQLSRSNLDSHLVAASAERASWQRVQGPADVR
jgi:anti-sigma factor RsiW